MNFCLISRSFFASAGFVLLAVMGGCIHPNLPSVRYGNQAPMLLEEVVDGESFEVAGVAQPAFPIINDGGPVGAEIIDEPYCEGDGYLTDRSGSHHQPDTPEAPWPRFHPLPTRPVLGPY